MDLPILGTIDLTPTGIFLFFAAALAVVYFGWQLFGVGRAGREATRADQAALTEAGTEADQPVGAGPSDDQEAAAASDDDADGVQKP